MPHAVVFVPGVFGSVLKLGDEVVWPGSPLELVFPFGKMDQLLSKDLVATDVIRRVSISTQYQDLIDDLGRCGFRETGAPKTLYLCPYDWRKDNADSARTLAKTVNQAVQSGADRITLIGHSMGGLVSRYYLESGEFKDEPGLKAVTQLIALATPHRGAPAALPVVMGLEKRLFLSKEQVAKLASHPDYPSAYQLLPPKGEPYAWNEAAAAELGTVDVYEPALVAALKLSQANLVSAAGFHARLSLDARPKVNGQLMRYFFFGGSRQKTTSAVAMLETEPSKWRVRKTELDDAGDGTVPLWSGFLNGIQGLPVGGEHSTIYRNQTLRQNLAILLGRKGVLAADPVRVEVAVRDRVVNPEDTVNTVLSFGPGIDKLDGALRIRMAILDDGGALRELKPVSQHPIHYQGLNAQRLAVTFPAPASPGMYQVDYLPQGHTEAAGRDELIVQEA